VSTKDQEQIFDRWKAREAIAEAMIPLIGKLYRERNIAITMFGRSLINRSVVSLIQAHRYIRQVEGGAGLNVQDTFQILEALSTLDLGPSRIDLGKLTQKFLSSGTALSVKNFVRDEVADILGEKAEPRTEAQDVILYGFGRIGRLVARLLIEKAGSGKGLRLRAIVVRKGSEDDLQKRVNLLRRDSVHGPFRGTLNMVPEENAMIANGNYIKIIYSDSPSTIDYESYGIKNAIVVDNTGKWRDEEGLQQHLKSKGVGRVVLTAPGKGNIKNIVYGVNHHLITNDDLILSAASCTTNAIVPVLKAVKDKFGVASGHVETVHAYTNDQNLIDNFHKGDRRGRSAALNMVITETGAAKAVAKALPELSGKLTGNAIRVPIPDVSLAILNLNLNQATTVNELNDFMQHTALYSNMHKQIDYVNSPEVVSSDFIGSRYASIVDSLATIVDGNRCVLYVWYDNEFGYSAQVLRILQKLAGITYPVIPKI